MSEGGVDGRQVREIMTDRDPEGGARFPSVAAMREAKLRDWLRVARVGASEEQPEQDKHSTCHQKGCWT